MGAEDFDPLSDEFTRDPYRAYDRLRIQDAPYFYEPLNCYLLSRYDEVDAAARSPQMLRSMTGLVSPEQIRAQQVAGNFHDMPNHELFVQFSMLEVDGELHRRLRMVVLREFSKSFVEKHREVIRQHVDRLLDEALAQGSVDFIEAVAARVPGHVIGSILGVPEADCPLLRKWSEEIVQYFDADRTAENKAIAERATGDFYSYLKALIADREQQPRDDLLTTLVRARQSGELTETELVSTSLLILAGGHGSTIDVIGTGMLALLSHPLEMEKIRRTPALVKQAVVEMFRYESPLPFFHRFAATELEVRGRRFPQGTKFGLLYGAANRDPDQFPGPGEFRVERVPNRHIAFGRGAHLCLGNNLAKLNMEILFERLLARTASIELDEPAPAYRTGLTSRGLKRLALRLG